MARLVIISKDLQGPVRNGGVGTAFYEYAKALAGQGHDVECVLTCPPEFIEKPGILHWVRLYFSCGIKLTVLDEVFPASLTRNHKFFIPDLERAYRAKVYIDTLKPDAVIFGDYGGDGYFMVKDLARPYQTVCVVHGTSFWGKVENSEALTNTGDFTLFDVELTSIEEADTSIFPSRYVYQWHSQYFRKQPVNVKFVCNIYDPERRSGRRERNQTKKPKAIFYFGRLEARKGIDLFLAAIEPVLNKYPEIEAFAIGKLGVYDSGSVLNLLSRRLHKLHGRLKIVTGLNSNQAIELIKEKNGMVVFPSRADNCPLTILECVFNDIPVIMSDSGGQVELIDDQDLSSHVFPNSAGDITALISGSLINGIRTPRASKFVNEAKSSLLQLFSGIEKKAGNAVKFSPEICVSVCIPTMNSNPDRLLGLVERLIDDEIRPEVILVNDGGAPFSDEQKQRFEKLGVKYAMQPNRYPGAARNAAASYAKGEYLAFIDDDNVPDRHMLWRYLNEALHAKADIVSSWFFVQSAEDPKVNYIQAMLGLSGHSDIFENSIADNNFLIRTSVFRALNGYPVHWGVGFEDYQLLRKAAVEGYKIQIINEPLFKYSLNSTGVNNGSNTTAGFYKVASELFNKPGAMPFFVASIRALQAKAREKSFISAAYPSLRASLNDCYDKLDLWSLLTSALDEGISLLAVDKAICKHIFSDKLKATHFRQGLLNLLSGALSEVRTAEQSHIWNSAWMLAKYNEILPQSAAKSTLQIDPTKKVDKLSRLISLFRIGALHDAKVVVGEIYAESELRYLAEYPDIAEGVRSGVIKSGLQHYLSIWAKEPWRYYPNAHNIVLGNRILGQVQPERAALVA